MSDGPGTDFNIHDVNSGDELRVDQPLIPYHPVSHTWPKLPHKYGIDDPMGLWQFEYIKSLGVDQNSKVLEIGPGGFRLAQHLIPFLAVGHYCAAEVSRQGLDWGWNLLEDDGRDKQPKLFWGGDFQFEALNFRPDYVWAHSVFTHLNWNHIGQCLYGLGKIASPHTKVYATYFRCNATPWEPQPYGPPNKKKHSGKHLSFGSKDPYHYRYQTMNDLAQETGWSVKHIELPAHPKGQSLLEFVVN